MRKEIFKNYIKNIGKSIFKNYSVGTNNIFMYNIKYFANKKIHIFLESQLFTKATVYIFV